MTAAPSIALECIMAAKLGSVDPTAFPEEEFDLYSIPAFDQGTPEVLRGSAIGSAKQIVQPGDVLLSRIVPHIRRAWVVGHERGRRIIASGEWIVFRGEAVEPKYLRHLLVSDRFHTEFMCTVSGVGGSLLRARPAYVGKIKIPLPSLPQQRRIAEILDEADALRTKRRSVLAQLDTLIQSVFIDMFGDPATNPKGWRIERLGQVAETTSGGTPRRDVDQYFGGRIPWVKSGELRGGVVTTTEETLTDRGLAESSAKVMPVGTVLVAMYGATVGAVAVLGIEAATNQAVCCISPSDQLLTDFLVFLLRCSTPSLLARRVGGAQPNLSQDLLRKLVVPVPPRQLQEAFAEKVACASFTKYAAWRSSDQMNALFGSLQHHAFRGEL